MKTVWLTPAHVWAITTEPAVFAQFPFLKPMEAACEEIHRKLSAATCVGCMKAVKAKVSSWMANAMASLIWQETKKNPATLIDFRIAVLKLLELGDDPDIRIGLVYTLKDGKHEQLTF